MCKSVVICIHKLNQNKIVKEGKKMKKLISVVLVVGIAFGCGYGLKATESKANVYTDTCTYYANNPQQPQIGGSFYGQEIWDINNPTLEDGKTYIVEINDRGTPDDATDDVVINWTIQE